MLFRKVVILKLKNFSIDTFLYQNTFIIYYILLVQMNIKIFKSDGTKNTFVIIYDNHNHNEIIKNIKFICNKFKTDGMLLISDIENYDFKMDYFNNDEFYLETMCANGARCVGLLMWKIKKCSKNITFVSGDGPHKLTIKNSNNISLSFKTPNFKNR